MTKPHHHNPRIWNGNVRRTLYKRLVEEFGSYDTWENASHPGNGHAAAFNAFCDAFAVWCGANSGKAVQHQIRFAMPETTNGSTWERHALTAIMNKAAALEAGFIADHHLPHLYAVGRE